MQHNPSNILDLGNHQFSQCFNDFRGRFTPQKKKKKNVPNAHSNQLTMAVSIEICNGKHLGKRDSPASRLNSYISVTNI